MLYKYVYVYGGRDPYAGRSAKTVLRYIYIYICNVQMIENEWLCVTDMYVCVRDTNGMLDVLLYMIVNTSDTGHVYSYQHKLIINWK